MATATWNVADLAQAWSDALRKSLVAGQITGDELDALTDFEYAVWDHPAAEQIIVIGAALSEAFECGDNE
ncbi:MAG: hypothetical protein ACE5HA_09010 [Anaerolineae bacterium]